MFRLQNNIDRNIDRARGVIVRRGLSLVELLVAMTIMIIMVGAIGALSMAIQIGSEHSQGETLATQHARVALERIERAISQATANEQFPGCLVLTQQVGTWRFPDTLVVWRPSAAAADPDGLPLLRELVIFSPDPDQPNILLETTLPGSSSRAPPLSDTAGWISTVSAILNSNSAQRTELTDLLRTADLTDDFGGTSSRGLARFILIVSPSTDQWDQYEAGNLDWNDIDWVQDLHSSQTGLRQVACHIELQLTPGQITARNDTDGQSSLPFIGSAALIYQMRN